MSWVFLPSISLTRFCFSLRSAPAPELVVEKPVEKAVAPPKKEEPKKEEPKKEEPKVEEPKGKMGVHVFLCRLL
jgi:ribosomal protein L12E/L44/L45/RPP1/RPP2